MCIRDRRSLTPKVENTKSERKVLEIVNHPFIVSLHYAFQVQQLVFACVPVQKNSTAPSARYKKALPVVSRYWYLPMTVPTACPVLKWGRADREGALPRYGLHQWRRYRSGPMPACLRLLRLSLSVPCARVPD
eukprot:3114198-Rhodomonas_salina.1